MTPVGFVMIIRQVPVIMINNVYIGWLTAYTPAERFTLWSLWKFGKQILSPWHWPESRYYRQSVVFNVRWFCMCAMIFELLRTLQTTQPLRYFSFILHTVEPLYNIFLSKIFTKDTPWLAREGGVWGVFYELTHLPTVPHICVSESGPHWFR